MWDVIGAMGNRHTNAIAADVKKQAECQTLVDKFVDLNGGGELVGLMKEARKDGNYEKVSLCVLGLDYMCWIDAGWTLLYKRKF